MPQEKPPNLELDYEYETGLARICSTAGRGSESKAGRRPKTAQGESNASDAWQASSQPASFGGAVTPPVFTLIAGANGAGKSTLTAGNPETFFPTSLLDPDSFARSLTPKTSSPIAAGREVLRLAKEHLDRRESFTIETTLSGRNYLEMMVRARRLGFEVVLIYIGTEEANINLYRIEQRVLGGGHDVPESDVRRRYKRSLDHLPVAVARADHTLLFDNSTESAYRLVGVLSLSSVQWFQPLPRWVAALRLAVSQE